MSVLRACGLAVLATMACGDAEDLSGYGQNHPGIALPEGGEIRHENVRFLGQPVQTWLMVYQYTGPTLAATAKFAAPEMDGKGQFGNCVDERNPQNQTWPFKPITGATYLDLTKVQLTGPGITGMLNIPKAPAGTGGNSTFRAYGTAYGGGAPDPTGTKPLGFNGTLTAAASTPGGDYTLDIGKGAAMTYHMPEQYATPLGIGGAATVMITAHQDLEFNWTAPANKRGPQDQHLKETYFNFTFFADPTVTPTATAAQPQFICFPDVDGHTKIPAAVVDLLPAGGLIVNADLGHYMEAREAAAGEQRRFDLVTIFCNISLYSKQ